MGKLYQHFELLILYAILWKSGSACNIATWDVNNDGSVIFSLTLDTQRSVVIFNIKATGMFDQHRYMALGISLDQFMTNTDVNMVEDFGDTYHNITVGDRFANSRSRPELDQKQNITTTADIRIGNDLDVTFEKPMDTMDTEDIVIDSTTPFYLLYAQGTYSFDPGYHGSNRKSSSGTYLAVCNETITSTESSTSEAETTQEPTSTEGTTNTLEVTTQDDNTTDSKANAIGTFGRSYYSWSVLLRIFNAILMAYIAWLV